MSLTLGSRMSACLRRGLEEGEDREDMTRISQTLLAEKLRGRKPGSSEREREREREDLAVNRCPRR